MKVKEKRTPREFIVGIDDQITIKDCGNIELENDEQITFTTKGGSEYDICRKEWGYYATPSINRRLKSFGFKTALVKNIHNHYFVMLVQKKLINKFINYIKMEKNEIVEWLDEK